MQNSPPPVCVQASDGPPGRLGPLTAALAGLGTGVGRTNSFPGSQHGPDRAATQVLSDVDRLQALAEELHSKVREDVCVCV